MANGKHCLRVAPKNLLLRRCLGEGRALNAIPASVSGCTGSTDQRGVARPQGSGCDVGAYKRIVTNVDAARPAPEAVDCSVAAAVLRSAR